MPDFTVLQTVFQHVLHSLAYKWTLLQAEQAHDLHAIQFWADGVEVLLLLQRGDPVLYSVNGYVWPLASARSRRRTQTMSSDPERAAAHVETHEPHQTRGQLHAPLGVYACGLGAVSICVCAVPGFSINPALASVGGLAGVRQRLEVLMAPQQVG